MGGGFGVSSPDDHFQAERLGWREGCLQAGAVIAPMRAASGRMGNPESNQRDSAAAGKTDNATLCVALSRPKEAHE